MKQDDTASLDYDQHLERLESACAAVFGRAVSPSTRAAAALIEAGHVGRLFNVTVSVTSDVDTFANIVTHSPACADILTRNGIRLDPLKPERQGSEHSDGHVAIRYYNRLLRDVFAARWPEPEGLSSLGKLVRDSGALTEVDLFAGCIDWGRSALVPNQTVDTLLSSSDSYEGYVTPENESVLLRIESECRMLGNIDPSHSRQQFVLFLDDAGQFRIRPFGANALGHCDQIETPKGPFLFRGGVLQHHPSSHLFSIDLLEQLEDLVNSSTTSEQDFQEFFESNPQFLVGLDYESLHPQPVLFQDDGGRLIPDFFLEKIDARWSAILDLKRAHDAMVVRRRNRVYFSQWIHNAIAQLQFYREWFESSKHRSELMTSLGLPAPVFRPKMVLVAGRSHHFLDDVERIRLLTNQDANLELWTYDDILQRARRYHDFLSL